MISGKSLRSRQNSIIGEEISDTLMTKTKELFYMCDPLNKGYVTKDELYRLKDELGLNDHEVENAFDQLDTDKDKYLTIEEFTAGFGLFLGLETPTVKKVNDVMKPDFAFQVFNLVDKDDKGYVTRDDFIDCATTLEMELSQVDTLVKKLRRSSDNIHFDEFAMNIESVVAFSPALQEIKDNEERERVIAVKRQILTQVFNMDLANQNDADIDRLLCEQASTLFKLCDYDNKNYVTRDDLLTLSQELTLSHDQIMETFSYLDKNRNGYLTLREFINGFGSFVGFDTEHINKRKPSNYNNKAEELFNLCDTDRKGYVTKQDLNCLITKVGLPEQHILDVFQQLDTDENGLISFDEFVSGFINFPGDVELNNNSNNIESNNCEETRTNEDVIENGFEEMYLSDCRTLSNGDSPHSKTENGTVNGNHVFLRQQSIKYEATTDIGEMIEKMEEEVGSSISKSQLTAIRDTVCNSGDTMTVQMFETFISKVYSELKNAKDEAKHLENVLEKKSLMHNAEIKKIYEEMEQQFQNEKVKLLEQENRRESIINGDVQKELQDKQSQLDKYMQRQGVLERRLEVIKQKEQQLKNENTELLKENVMLENKLNTSMDSMETLRSNLQRLEEQTSLEKRETLRAAIQATQGLQYEHENLVRELDVLRTTNEKLRDDRDTLESSLKMKVGRTSSWADELENHRKAKVHRTGSTMSKYVQPSRATSTPVRKPLSKQGSVMSAYFDPVSDHMHSPIDDTDSNSLNLLRNISVDETPLGLPPIGEVDSLEMDPLSGSRVIDCISHPLQSSSSPSHGSTISSLTQDSTSPKHESTPSSPRHAPVGMNTEDRILDNVEMAPEHPSRLYKVVLVGDSNVGKSSFIHRFCFNTFKSTFSATIGVDFQVKTMKVNHEWIALQLWDTAGQERFRSITKNYFRRADGVIVMFDLCSETSFLNVKGWMLNIEECAEADVMVMMIGNKLDLVEENEGARRISYKMASELARDYNALYFEVSACSGVGVNQAIEKLAKQMELNEDSRMKYSVLNLDAANVTKKKRCCNR